MSNEKYEDLDKRNFDVIRERHSPKNILLKYTGYNQIGDILFCEQSSFYSAKINIAIGGFMGSGKSSLINTILGEKRCLEGRGGSITNYISQFSLNEYPINLIDFPGFRAKQNGEKNTSLFIKEIESKISDFKKLNEAFHCFLFCIKYEDRIFDENDEDTLEVLNAIIKLKIRTFFLITNCDKENSKNFKNFKKIVVKNLNKVVPKDPELRRKIFGDDLNQDIIPILAKDKEFCGIKAKPYGLDNLFKILYEYFKPKIINYDKKLHLDEQKLKEFTKSNELLKIFESKNKLCKDFKDKMKSEIEKFVMQLFLTAPKYIYKFSEDSFFEIFNKILNHIFDLFNYYLNQQSNTEILGQLQVTLVTFLDRKQFIQMSLNGGKMKWMLNEIKEMSDEIKKKIPWYAKVLFPVLSPFYYLLGTPIIKFYSIKLLNYFLDNIASESNLEDFIYEIYFGSIINNLNRGIESLDIIREKFEQHYIIIKVEKDILRIIEDENDNINLHEFTKIFTELINNNINPLNIFNQYFKEKLDFCSPKRDKQWIEQKKEKIVVASRDIIKQKMQFPENDILIEFEKDEQKLIDYIISKYKISNLIAEKLYNDSDLGKKGRSKFHEHILVYSHFRMKDPKYAFVNYYCDHCEGIFSRNVNNYYCKSCHFNLCEKCFIRSKQYIS